MLFVLEDLSTAKICSERYRTVLTNMPHPCDFETGQVLVASLSLGFVSICMASFMAALSRLVLTHHVIASISAVLLSDAWKGACRSSTLYTLCCLYLSVAGGEEEGGGSRGDETHGLDERGERVWLAE